MTGIFNSVYVDVQFDVPKFEMLVMFLPNFLANTKIIFRYDFGAPLIISAAYQT